MRAGDFQRPHDPPLAIGSGSEGGSGPEGRRPGEGRPPVRATLDQVARWVEEHGKTVGTLVSLVPWILRRPLPLLIAAGAGASWFAVAQTRAAKGSGGGVAREGRSSSSNDEARPGSRGLAQSLRDGARDLRRTFAEGAETVRSLRERYPALIGVAGTAALAAGVTVGALAGRRWR